MTSAPQRRRKGPAQTPDLETNTDPDLLPDDLRRRDQQRTPLDSLPPRDDGERGEKPAGGGFTPAEDGGNDQHPIHDDDQDDAGPSVYEREIDRLNGGAFERIG